MFDLNVDISSENHKTDLASSRSTEMSGTCSTISTIISYNGNKGIEEEGGSDDYLRQQRTRKLFPVDEAGDCHSGWDGPVVRGCTKELIRASNGEDQWLKLSVSEEMMNPAAILQQKSPPQQVMKKSRRGPRSRSSQYRGVTFYRRTGRWESHIWDCGKQVYLGGFDTAHAAARAYDRAAIKFRGVDADINFNANDYEDDMNRTKNLSKEEFVRVLRRQGTSYPRRASSRGGVTSPTWHKFGLNQQQLPQLSGSNYFIRTNERRAAAQDITNQGGMMMTSDNLNLNLAISSSYVSSIAKGPQAKLYSQQQSYCDANNSPAAGGGQPTFRGLPLILPSAWKPHHLHLPFLRKMDATCWKTQM